MNPSDTSPQPEQNRDGHMLPGDVADLLVSRVVDGVATDRDWNAFQAVAGSDIAVWRELAMNLGAAQRDQTALSAAVEAHAAAANHVGLPSDETAMVIPMSRTAKAWNFARGGLGWVAAAALALAVYMGRFNPPNRIDSNPNKIDTAGFGSLAEFFSKNNTQTKDIREAYIDHGMQTGEVLGELPDKLMVQAQPVKLDDGTDGYEIIYVRQILEKTRLPNMYKMEIGPRDELGNTQLKTVPMRITPPRKGST